MIFILCLSSAKSCSQFTRRVKSTQEKSQKTNCQKKGGGGEPIIKKDKNEALKIKH